MLPLKKSGSPPVGYSSKRPLPGPKAKATGASTTTLTQRERPAALTKKPVAPTLGYSSGARVKRSQAAESVEPSESSGSSSASSTTSSKKYPYAQKTSDGDYIGHFELPAPEYWHTNTFFSTASEANKAALEKMRSMGYEPEDLFRPEDYKKVEFGKNQAWDPTTISSWSELPGFKKDDTKS